MFLFVFSSSVCIFQQINSVKNKQYFTLLKTILITSEGLTKGHI